MKRFLTVIAILCILAASLAGAYFAGIWIPNSREAQRHAVRGIDVSHHQGAVNWPAVAADGIAFAYIKATEGVSLRDPNFTQNWNDAASSHLARGAYHFFTFNSPGRQQADNFIAVVPPDSSSLPPAVDLEFWGNSKHRPEVAAFRNELEFFLSRLREAYGKEPIIYTSEEFCSAYLANDPPRRLWIRHVFTAPNLSANAWLFWQYSDRGRVAGVADLVDLNVFFGDKEDFDTLVHSNSPSR